MTQTELNYNESCYNKLLLKYDMVEKHVPSLHKHYYNYYKFL